MVQKYSVLGPMLGAVSAALRGSATLQTLLGGAGRVHTSNPPAELSPPYVVVQDVDSIPQRLIGNARAYHDGQVTIEIHDDGTSALLVTQAMEIVCALLDGAALTIDGFDRVFILQQQERRDPLPPGQERATVSFGFKVRRKA